MENEQSTPTQMPPAQPVVSAPEQKPVTPEDVDAAKQANNRHFTVHPAGDGGYSLNVAAEHAKALDEAAQAHGAKNFVDLVQVIAHQGLQKAN